MTDLPAGWRRATFAEVARVASDLVDPASWPDAPHIAPNHIESGTGRLSGVMSIAADGVTSPKHRFRQGQILYSKIRPYLAKVTIAPSDGLCSADMYPIETSLDERYLLHWMLSDSFTESAAGHQGRSVLPKINVAALHTLPVPIAPSAEQGRIVDAIEEAFSKLDAGEAGLRTVRRLLDRMRAAVLADAVTGRLVPQDPTDTPAAKLLADVGASAMETHAGSPLPDQWAWTVVGALLAGIEAGKSFATLGRPAVPGEIGVIKVSAMTWGTFQSLENKAIPPGSTVDPRWVVKASDLLFSRANTSEYVGACVLVAEDHPNLILSDKSLRLVPSGAVSSEWLLHYLRSVPARMQIEALATGTKDSMRNISQAKLRSMTVALPPIEEQQRVVAELERQFSFLDACDRAIDAGLTRSAALRRSVLKAAFEGKLVPQDPTDEPASVLLERIRAERAAAPPPARRARRTA